MSASNYRKREVRDLRIRCKLILDIIGAIFVVCIGSKSVSRWPLFLFNKPIGTPER
jgi:hypothetical protein